MMKKIEWLKKHVDQYEKNKSHFIINDDYIEFNISNLVIETNEKKLPEYINFKSMKHDGCVDIYLYTPYLELYDGLPVNNINGINLHENCICLPDLPLVNYVSVIQFNESYNSKSKELRLNYFNIHQDKIMNDLIKINGDEIIQYMNEIKFMAIHEANFFHKEVGYSSYIFEKNAIKNNQANLYLEFIEECLNFDLVFEDVSGFNINNIIICLPIEKINKILVENLTKRIKNKKQFTIEIENSVRKNELIFYDLSSESLLKIIEEKENNHKISKIKLKTIIKK